jgi:hypothetical protein
MNNILGHALTIIKINYASYFHNNAAAQVVPTVVFFINSNFTNLETIIDPIIRNIKVVDEK